LLATRYNIECHCACYHTTYRQFFQLHRLFTKASKLTGSRREVADFLQTRPGGKKPQNIDEVRDLVEAVQLLCEEGEFWAAHDLHMTRLAKGGYEFNVFRDLPAPVEGLESSLAFVGNADRQIKLETALGKHKLAAYISAVSLYSYHLGNLMQARAWRYKALEIYSSSGQKINQAFVLNNSPYARISDLPKP